MAKVKRSGAGPVVLLDAAEQKVVDASQGRALAKATRAQLGALIGQARALRDKWRDQFRSQRRTTQRTAAARGVGGNDRSQAKSEVFADALGRLETQLAAIGGTVAAAVKAATKPGPTKAARTHGHRASRAATRATLAEFVTAKPGGKKVSRAAAVKAAAPAKPTAAVKKPATAAPAQAEAAAAKTPLAPPVVSKKRLIGRPATVAAAKATGKNKNRVIVAEPATQLRAATKLKASRVRLAGLDTRMRGHAKAAGRRQQGRRDGRSR